MLLAIDIGNTNVTVGVFDGNDLRTTFRLSTDTRKLPDEYAIAVNQLLPLKGLSLGDIDAVAMCSVVPPLTPSFIHLADEYFWGPALGGGGWNAHRGPGEVRLPP